MSAFSDSSRPDVIIVGAGLAGLSCAVHLHRAGRRCLLLESSDGVGGRVRTDVVDGFRLDRGFQVLLTAYPEVRSLLDLPALRPRAFRPGALVRLDGRFHALGDPLRLPTQALRTLLSPVASLTDKLRVARLRQRCLRGSLADQFAGPDITTLAFLRQCGLGPRIIERFFRPFLGGVFLDPELETSSRMFRFVFRMFASGEAVVPELGMGEIPAQLARRLPDGWLRLDTAVDRVEPGRVTLASGEVLESARVVVATDGEAAGRLVAKVRAPRWREVACVYLEADRAPIAEPSLILDGDGAGPVNNLCFPTQVSPSYGPAGRTLVSASVLGAAAGAGDLVDRVRAQLVGWFGARAGDWRPLRTVRIRRALPAQPPGWLEPPERPAKLGDGLYLAGDHLDTASTNGALAAGRRAAAAILEDLAPGRARGDAS